jgi:hypothetical protein
MSYGFDESTSQSSGANIMAPGINENVKLVNVVYEPAKSDGTGDLVLRFNFEDAGGAKFSHVEWAIDEERERSNARQWGKDVEEHLKSRYVAQSERIFHILTTFVPREVLIKSVGKTDSFATFSQALISALGNNHIDKLIRIKVILNKKDYLTFPMRAIKPFIQPMNEPNKLAIDPKWERVERMTPTDESSTDWEATETSSVSTNEEPDW